MKKYHSSSSNNIFDESLVIIKENKLITTSLMIAKVFNKKHFHVMEAIRNLECSEEFRQSNFRLTFYIDIQGKKQPMYEVTKDGYSMLAFGFTGKKATFWKEKYIKTFNKMESKLRELMCDDRNSIGWKKKRIKSKEVRSGFCKTIEHLIEYAKSQGSEHANHY